MRFTHGLRAISLATVVAIAAISAFSAPVSATDPAATPAPDASAPVATPTPDPAASPDPAMTPSPDPLASPDPLTSTSPDAGATLSPDPTTAPDALVTDPVATTTPVVVATVKPKPNFRARILRIALLQRHDAYVRGGIGPNTFDCSGLVRYVFRKAGVSRYLGGGHSARAMYRWARLHHLTSRTHPRVGDVVVWGRGSHVGIYIGRGKAISALNPRLDIRITRIHSLRASFTTFIHVRLP